MFYEFWGLVTCGVALAAVSFALAGVRIGCVETAENAAVASLAPEEYRESAFGLLAAIQSFGNLAASSVAGIVWTAISPTAAFLYIAAWMLVSLLTLSAGVRQQGGDHEIPNETSESGQRPTPLQDE